MAKDKEPIDIDSKAAKLKALEAALGKIEKDFGKGSIMRLGSQQVEDIEVIPTGSISLDHALGVGGYPKGRIIEIFGPESSGKTTIALHAIAEVQKIGGEAAFIDAEHALDPVYAANLGVDVDSLLVAQPDNGEQALEITETMVRSGAIDIVVVDRNHLLIDLRDCITNKLQLSLTRSSTESRDAIGYCSMEFPVHSSTELQEVIDSISRIDGVEEVKQSVEIN